MRYLIKRSSTYPFTPNENDEVLAELSSNSEVQGELDYLGYLGRRVELVNGVRYYYKAKNDGVYVAARG